MGEEYNWGENPINDFLLQLIFLGNDITSEKFSTEIRNSIMIIISEMGIDSNDLYYLDYEIKKNKNGLITIIPGNIVCAMWFIGAVPVNCDFIFRENYVIFKDRKYRFNKETKKLTWKKLKG